MDDDIEEQISQIDILIFLKKNYTVKNMRINIVLMAI